MPCGPTGLEDRRAGRDGDGLRRRSSARPAAAASIGGGAGGRDGRAGGSSRIGGIGRGRAAAATGGRSQRHQLRLSERALDRGARRLAEAADASRRASPGRSRARSASSVARSPRGRPAARRASSSSWRTVPTRQGTHWPHDSSRKNAAIRRSVPTRSAVSSKTITTPEPSVAPIARVALERQRRVERVRPDEDAGRAAEQHRLEGAAVRDAAGQRRAARRSVAPNATS